MSDELLHEHDVFLNVEAHSKGELFSFIAQQAKKLGVTKDAAALETDLMCREEQMTTGLTDCFAIPHTKSAHVERVEVFYIVTKEPLSWETMDGDKAQYFFVLLVPEENEGNIHLQMISALAVCLLEDEFTQYIKASTDASELIDYINLQIHL
ncbi:MAG: PTS sugar transporter subunit IIA [Atopobiaceae bacterium]|nr:PTS sugar transporter subunit IIA [Atopobiaceae bacterium]